ncbi:MAG: ABC transporter permease [Tannerella sp.]|jgi:ABC-type transport system involved in multi-copper enzyme maturation permease subunit|nr:ABC transporter permease [Tannerella sp.]
MKENTFKTLVLREIHGAIVDFRFWVVLVLCLSIIPLSFYVSVKDYSQRLSDYHQAVQTYRDMTQVYASMKAEGVHPPSPLSIFSRGLGNKMPYKVITSRDGNYQIEYARPDNKKDLLGEIDFGFIVAFVLSILAVVFTFNCISGDKEQGLLRAILSNAVYRRQILLAKLAGNYLVFLAPFLLSMLIALLIVHFSGVIPVFSGDILPAILLMTAISLVFLFALFNLGLWISALTANSALSINVLLLIWIVLGLVVPKISPIISASIYPVESNGVFEAKKTLLRGNIFKEQRAEEVKLYEELRAQYNPGSGGLSSSDKELNSAYDEQVVPLRERYNQRIITETGLLSNDYDMRCNRQNNLAATIARLSPVGIVNNLMAEFSGTGHLEADNFLQHAKQYQETVKQDIYDKIIVKEYYSGSGSMTTTHQVDGFDSNTASVPVLDSYKYLGAGDVLQRNLVDIALLCVYGLLFFVCAFVSFLRFDVR